MRSRIYEIIEIADENDLASRVYDVTMMVSIVVSLIPVAAKSTDGIYWYMDIGTTFIFLIDYLLRLLTADKKIGKGAKSFLVYPVTPMAIIDLLAILPSLVAVNGGLRLIKLLRLLRTLRVFRVFKAVRYSKSIPIIIAAFKKQQESLAVVGVLASGYIMVSALIVISIEPETFPTFFDAVYWATVSLTTVGYGDIYAVSTAGKIITMISSVFGIAIVALPAGIITAGYMDEIKMKKKAEKEEQKEIRKREAEETAPGSQDSKESGVASEGRTVIEAEAASEVRTGIESGVAPEVAATSKEGEG
uniref:ion transporter n=1 Tax=Eubacterium cellulosolvens TaxID=29322 RepID=UPI000AD88995|nr:ion transporter [[Eubacterium] cellulosolvens]